MFARNGKWIQRRSSPGEITAIQLSSSCLLSTLSLSRSLLRSPLLRASPPFNKASRAPLRRLSTQISRNIIRTSAYPRVLRPKMFPVIVRLFSELVAASATVLRAIIETDTRVNYRNRRSCELSTIVVYADKKWRRINRTDQRRAVVGINLLDSMVM